MVTTSKGTTYTYDFSTNQPTLVGSESPDADTEKQTNETATKLIEEIKVYSEYNDLESAATYVCRQPKSGASFRSCTGTQVVVEVFPKWDKKE